MDSRWRPWAKFVALYELIALSVCALLFPFALFIHVANKMGLFNSVESSVPYVPPLPSGFYIVTAPIHWIVAVKLYSATEPEQKIEDALADAKLYRNVRIWLYALAVIGSIVTLDMISILAVMADSGIPMYIVFKYIKDLEPLSVPMKQKVIKKKKYMR